MMKPARPRSIGVRGTLTNLKLLVGADPVGASEEKGKFEELEMCPECGFPMVVAFKKGRAPWKFCFNPECPTNEELQKKKAEFKTKLASGEVEIVDGKIVDKGKGEEK